LAQASSTLLLAHTWSFFLANILMTIGNSPILSLRSCIMLAMLSATIDSCLGMPRPASEKCTEGVCDMQEQWDGATSLLQLPSRHSLRQEPVEWTTCMGYYEPARVQALSTQTSPVCTTDKTILDGLRDPIACLTHQLPGVFAKMCQMSAMDGPDASILPPASQSASKCALRYQVLHNINASLVQNNMHVITELRMAHALIPSLMRVYPNLTAAVTSGTAAIALGTCLPWVDTNGDGAMSDVEVLAFLKTVYVITDMAQNSIMLDGYTPQQMESWNGPEWTSTEIPSNYGDSKVDWLGLAFPDN